MTSTDLNATCYISKPVGTAYWIKRYIMADLRLEELLITKI